MSWKAELSPDLVMIIPAGPFCAVSVCLLFQTVPYLTDSNDIALLRLSSEVFLTSYVKLAPLPPSGEILPHNSPCYLTGYGRTSSESDAHLSLLWCCVSWSHTCRQPRLMFVSFVPSAGGSMTNRMMQAYLPTVNHETCTSSGWWGSTVKTTMICAGGGARSGCNVCLMF